MCQSSLFPAIPSEVKICGLVINVCQFGCNCYMFTSTSMTGIFVKLEDEQKSKC